MGLLRAIPLSAAHSFIDLDQGNWQMSFVNLLVLFTYLQVLQTGHIPDTLNLSRYISQSLPWRIHSDENFQITKITNVEFPGTDSDSSSLQLAAPISTYILPNLFTHLTAFKRGWTYDVDI